MDNENVAWEKILEKAGVIEWDSKPSTYVKVNPKDESYKKYENFSNCSHCFIFARTDGISLNNYDRKAIILMQVRFDGFLGFPGGLVDPGETPVEALNRELKEESGWVEEKGPITDEHYLFSHANEEQKMVLHFYAIEVTEEKMKEIEANTLKAPDYGEEVLGNFRVPIYTMKDSYRGFPSFLRNNFIGNAKIQLIEALINLKFLTTENVIQALNSRPLKTSSNNNN